MKKIISLALAVIFALSLAACERSDVPSGMQRAYAANAPYKLFVPKNWTVDASTMTAVAVSRDANPLSVTVTLASAGSSPEEYLTSYLDRFAEVYTDFSADPIENTILDGHAASKLTFTGTLITGDVKANYKYIEIVAADGDLFHIIVFSSEAAAFEGYAETITEITDNYMFAVPASPVDNEAHDAPAEMKYASNEIVDYDLYVPNDWVTDLSTGACTAYTDGGKTSISLTAWDVQYMVGAVENWRKTYDDEMKMISSDFTEITETEAALGGISGKRYESAATIAGTEYRFVQIAVVRKYMVYVLTYTTTAESADHMSDLDKIITEFSFR